MIVLPNARHRPSAPSRGRMLARLPASISAAVRAAIRFVSAPGDRAWRYGILAVLLYTLLAGNRGLVRLAGLLYSRTVIRGELTQLEARRGELERELRRYRRDPATIERVAREELDMVRAGEVVYKFPPVTP